MAQLNISEITNDGKGVDKSYRGDILLDKIFNKNKRTSEFNTTKGILIASSIEINDNKFAKYMQSAYSELQSLPALPQRQRKVIIKGKINKKTVDIKLNEIVKTEEFGGQSGGKKVNKGILFEDNFYQETLSAITGSKDKERYYEQVANLLTIVTKKVGSPVVKAENEGGKNQSRPIMVDGKNNLYIAPNSPKEHGKLLTDVTLTHENGHETYLSLKFGSTLTFINAGVSKNIFIQSEMKNGMVTNKTGVAILKALGIDNEMFCKVFNRYPNFGKGKNKVKKIVEVTNTKAISNLLKTAIGGNYEMVHGFENGKVFHWSVGPNSSSSWSKGISKAIIYYGGKSGTGKRIDMEFSNEYFDFKLNIRNKQSGIYPSHIMLDYTSKSRTGKKEL